MAEALAGVLAAHLLSASLCFAVARRGGCRPTLPLMLWTLLLPFFGQICFCLLAQAQRRPRERGEWLLRERDAHRRRIDPQRSAPITVPVEEALLINDVQQRRALMMNMLRSDPRKYVDVLLIARFNDDTETAHYATATLLEMQNRIQLGIQQLQATLQSQPDNDEARQAYLEQLDEYCRSGLLEGQLLRHERLLLAGALRDALPRIGTPANYALALRNALALNDASYARELGQHMRRTWPKEELSWLESLHVCVQAHDQAGLEELLAQIADAPVSWSAAGRDKLQFWSGRRA